MRAASRNLGGSPGSRRKSRVYRGPGDQPLTPLLSNQVRCICGKGVTLTRNGNLRKHKSPQGDECPIVTYGTVIELAEVPHVNINGDRCRLSPSGQCYDCNKPVSGERRFCGQCLRERGRL
jgi:hypothetical protein